MKQGPKPSSKRETAPKDYDRPGSEPGEAQAEKRFGIGDTSPEGPLPVKEYGDKPAIPRDEAMPKAEPKPAAPKPQPAPAAKPSTPAPTAKPAAPAPVAKPAPAPVAKPAQPAPAPIAKPMQPAPAPAAKPAATAPAAKPAAPAAPGSLGSEEKIARLKKAFEDGKISKELYEANVRKLKSP